MKLLTCHIENFGKLQDVFMDFSSGLNLFVEDNGWGKSTFAAFIKAMFYGLDEKGGRKKEERNKYAPWQGGVYGGSIAFETNGKQYMVTRVFKNKESEDEFELRDLSTNLISQDYSERLGEEIFHIDKASFSRTAFFGQNDCETKATDDINAKVGNLTQDTNDMNNFATADEALKNLLNKLSPTRATGSVHKRTSEITRLERLVKDGESISQYIEETQEHLLLEINRREQLKKVQKEKQNQQAKVSKMQGAVAKQDEWKRLKKEVMDVKVQLESMVSQFPGEIPDLFDVDVQMENCSRLKENQIRLEENELTEIEKGELSELAGIFAEGVPKDTEIQAKLEMCSSLASLKQESSLNRLGDFEKQELERLRNLYGDSPISISAFMSKWDARNGKKSALPSKQAAVAAMEATREAAFKDLNTGRILMIAGIAFLVIGIVLSIISLPFLLLSFVGTGVAIYGFTLGKKAKLMADNPELAYLQKQIEEDLTFIQDTDEEIAECFATYGKSFEENMVLFVLQEMASDNRELNRLLQKEMEISKKDCSQQIATMEKELIDFISKYRIPSDSTKFTHDLYKIREQVGRYQLLMKKKENVISASQICEEYETQLKGFIQSYKFEIENDYRSQFQRIRDCVNSYLDSKRLYDLAVTRLSQFEEQTDSDILNMEIPDTDFSLNQLSEDLENIAEKMELAHNAIVKYNDRLDELQRAYDDWEEDKEDLEAQKELQNIEKKKYQLLTKTRECLTKAKESMTSKYAAPLMSHFGQYYELITGDGIEKYHMDANTTITVDELGKQRMVESLSMGYRDLIGICLRLALVDAMYDDELPMIVMDDPFTNFDDKKIDMVKEFLEQLSKRYQILYFTCSKARK